MYNPPQRPRIDWDPILERALRSMGTNAREIEAMLREDAPVTDEVPSRDKVTCTSAGTLRSGVPICVVFDQYQSGAIRILDVYRIDPEQLEQIGKLAR
jgi:hypothetical protein